MFSIPSSAHISTDSRKRLAIAQPPSCSSDIGVRIVTPLLPEEYSRGDCAWAQYLRQVVDWVGKDKVPKRVNGGAILGGIIEAMRTPPPVNLPEGGTPAERLDMAFRKVLTVSKADILKAEGQEKRDREQKKRSRKTRLN